MREAVEINRASGARPDAFSHDLAMRLNNLSIRLSDFGRREEALDAIREAVAIRRDLAEGQPDAFSPELASSLGLFHRLLRNTGQIESALRAIQESFDLLEPMFVRLPTAYTPLMEAVAADYEPTATACGVAPDHDRLHAIRGILAELRSE